MSSYTHFGSQQPEQSVSYAKVSSISSVPPFERAYFPSAAQWPNSHSSKRRLCRQRKHLAWLSYALMVVFVFGIYFCRLKGSSGNGAMVANRKLAEETDGDEESDGHLEGKVNSELCHIIGETTGSAEHFKAPGEPSALPESAEVQTRTLSGKRKRKKTQEDTGVSTSRQQDTAKTQPPLALGQTANTLSEGSGDVTGTDEQLMKRARIAEWAIDPVEDIDFLLSTRQSISPGGLAALGLQALLNTGNNGVNGSVARPQPVSFPGASQVQGTANGSSPQVHFGKTTEGAHATLGTSDIHHAKKEPAVEAPATLASSSLQYPASSTLPQLEGGRMQAQELAAVVHGKPSKIPNQEHSTQHQDLHRPPAQGDQRNYTPPASSASSTQSVLRRYLIARASARRQGDNVAQPGPSEEDTQVDPAIREKLLKHPFYRLPAVESGVLVHYFDWTHAVNSSVFPRQLAQKFLEFQRIICKDTLSQSEVDALGFTTWDLLRDAASTRITILTKPSYYELVEPLANRFLLVDALFCACEILGKAAGKEHWWPGVMSKLAAPPVLMGKGDAKATPEVKQFVESVCAALRIYQRGDRPSPEVVVGIKKQLFGDPPIHRAFSRMVWGWFRQVLSKAEQS